MIKMFTNAGIIKMLNTGEKIFWGAQAMAILCKNCGTPLVFDPFSQKDVCNTCNSKWHPEEVRTTLCKECGTPLVYDPLKKHAFCKKCNTAWSPEEVNDPYRNRLEKVRAMLADSEMEDVIDEFIDCYVYVCDSCGAHVMINGTEASTTCLYCGSPSVVFERIAKEKAPEFIIPFSVTKEMAVDLVKTRLGKGLFIPKAIKNLKPDMVRGIYVPYWICDGMHMESAIIRGITTNTDSGEEERNKDARVEYFGRSGILKFKNLTQDGSLMLADESTVQLEPFDLSKLRIFNEGYLLGFYSDVSDVKKHDLVKAVNKRAEIFFEEDAIRLIRRSNLHVERKYSRTLVNEDVRYCMFPVWFVSFEYKGKHHTILINGDTGKVVGGIPWNKAAFDLLVAGIGLGLTALFGLIFYHIIDSWLFNDGHIIALILAGVLGLFYAGIARIKKMKKNLNLTQSAVTFNFMKKRQGGDE